MKISDAQKEILFNVWGDCDTNDKSTEYMFQLMSDSTNLDYDDVVDFVMTTTTEEREEWYQAPITIFGVESSNDEFLLLTLPNDVKEVFLNKKDDKTEVVFLSSDVDDEGLCDFIEMDGDFEKMGFVDKLEPNIQMNIKNISYFRELSDKRNLKNVFVLKKN